MDLIVKWYPLMVEGMEMLAGFHYFIRFIGKKAKAVHYLLYLTVAGIFMAAFPVGGSGMFLFGASLVAAAWLLYREKGWKTLLYGAVCVELLQVCFGLFDSLSYLLFPAFYARYPQTAGIYMMLLNGLLALLLFVLCGQIIQRHFLHVAQEGQERSLLSLVPMLLLVLVGRYISTEIYGDTIYVLPDGSIQGKPGFFLLVTQLLGIASLFCILYTDKKAAENFRLRMECVLLEQEARGMEQYVEEARLRYERTGAFRHDVRNHMAVVAELLRQGKSGQALKYLGEMEDTRAQLDDSWRIGNPVLDILVGAKLSAARDCGIEVSCCLKLPCPCGIRDMDFCIVLSNALDNALAACRKTDGPKRYIAVGGRVQGDMILLKVENSYGGEAGFKAGRGLGNIRAVAEKYQGKTEVEVREGMFRLSVLLVIPQKKE